MVEFEFNVGDIVRCLNADYNGNTDHFIVTQKDYFGYSIYWYEPNLTGMVNYNNVSEKDNKIFIFGEHQVEILTEQEKLIFQLKNG